MNDRIRRVFRPLAIGAMIGLISFLHFRTVDSHPLLHELTQRLYYLPVIYAAWRYGLRGGLVGAFASIALFLPHMKLHLHEPEIYDNQTAEMILFLVIGIVTGLLSDAQKRERSRYDQAVRQLLLSDRLASLGQLSAGLVHEVRNPLASIKGAAEALDSDIPVGNSKRPFLDAISGEVNRLDSLITDFLTFARPRPPEMLPTHPNTVVRSVVALTSNEIERQQILLETSLDEKIPESMMDGEQIKQALLNLVINAIQATPPGGRIMLSTSIKNDLIRMTVQDSGTGIPASIRNQLFVPFTTTKEGGTGLGLAIAHSLVQHNDGSITVNELSGGGTVFQIELKLNSGLIKDGVTSTGSRDIAVAN